ncbi:hypothetical protein HPP92_006865 [Vanilla planifolia]|uniref:Uncharacterized protein n=1 Tax=Vanilla planifolia TaxID=51239 RepID=A0A835RQ21_VANPL|nr:hypothetical protein HPP92_006865 [Vanilla planifolia]
MYAQWHAGRAPRFREAVECTAYPRACPARRRWRRAADGNASAKAVAAAARPLGAARSVTAAAACRAAGLLSRRIARRSDWRAGPERVIPPPATAAAIFVGLPGAVALHSHAHRCGSAALIPFGVRAPACQARSVSHRLACWFIPPPHGKVKVDAGFSPLGLDYL